MFVFFWFLPFADFTIKFDKNSFLRHLTILHSVSENEKKHLIYRPDISNILNLIHGNKLTFPLFHQGISLFVTNKDDRTFKLIKTISTS